MAVKGKLIQKFAIFAYTKDRETSQVMDIHSIIEIISTALIEY
jgi:hypothetical protein